MCRFWAVITRFTVLLFHKATLQTTLHRRLLLSQQYNWWRMEHEGSSSPDAMEPSTTGLQQVRVWTDAMLVQHRNAFVVYFLAFAVGCGRRYWVCNCSNHCTPAKTAQFDGPFHPGNVPCKHYNTKKVIFQTLPTASACWYNCTLCYSETSIHCRLELFLFYV